MPAGGDADEAEADDDFGDIDEWTFIGDETDADTTRIRERGASDAGISDHGIAGTP